MPFRRVYSTSGSDSRTFNPFSPHHSNGYEPGEAAAGLEVAYALALVAGTLEACSKSHFLGSSTIALHSSTNVLRWESRLDSAGEILRGDRSGSTGSSLSGSRRGSARSSLSSGSRRGGIEVWSLDRQGGLVGE